MKHKAIIFDIDATALDSPKEKLPTERLVRALQNLEEEYFLCAATGRSWPHAKTALQGMGLKDYCVISSGTQICNPASGEIVWQCTIDDVDLQQIYEVARQYPEGKFISNDVTEEDYLAGGFPLSDVIKDEPVYFFEQIVPQTLAAEVVEKYSQIEGIAVTLCVSQIPGSNDIHITNRAATKEHAINELLAILGIDTQHTIGVGDGHNDIHLFASVGHKVAMGNAVPELKTRADEIIGTVQEDGFASYLERLVDKTHTK